jgi:hypothetical protein
MPECSRSRAAKPKRRTLVKVDQTIRLGAVAILALLLLPSAARATTLTYGANFEFSNAQAPGGSTPWFTVVFDDHNSVGSVDFLLSAGNLVASENISELDLNLIPSQYADIPLTFSSELKAGSFDSAVISQAVDAFKADGDGFYDIQLLFTTGGTAAKVFNNGDVLHYTISGPGLTATSFQSLSNPGGGAGPYYIAGHVQNTTGAGHGGSGWVTDSTGGTIGGPNIPEPTTIVMSLIAAALAVPLARRVRSK